MWNTPTIDPQLGLDVHRGREPDPVLGGHPRPREGALHGLDRGPQRQDRKAALALPATHHDIWDYDATNPTILFDLEREEGHRPRRQDRAGSTSSIAATASRSIGIPEKKVPQNASAQYVSDAAVPGRRRVLEAVRDGLRVQGQAGPQQEAVQGRVHLRAVRRTSSSRLRTRRARRGELAAVGVQPGHRLHVHLLEGHRSAVACRPAREAEAAAAR